MRMIAFLSLIPVFALAEQHDGSHQHNMQLTDTGIVMNQNFDTLPLGCDEISREHEFTIYGGKKYVADKPGLTFGMSEHEVHVEPCSRITVTFVNEDDVRHQWMVHGLPKYLYPAGMFHLEAMGGQSQTGTFIVPGDRKNYLVHCDMAQHMEKGMRGQLVVGGGSGDLWGVAGVSDAFYRSSYLPGSILWLAVLAALVGFIVTWKLRF